MPLYRGAAELRRIHRDAARVLAGVVVEGDWHPIHRSIERPSRRLMEAGLVDLVDLPDFIAADSPAAIRVALWLAREAFPLDAAEPVVRGSRTVSIEIDV